MTCVAPNACVRLLLGALLLAGGACRSSTLPSAMSDEEFRALVESLSEPAGAFTLSDNLVSNEPRFAENVARVRAELESYRPFELIEQAVVGAGA